MLPSFNGLSSVGEAEHQSVVIECFNNRYFALKGILVKFREAEDFSCDAITQRFWDLRTPTGLCAFCQVGRAVPEGSLTMPAAFVILAALGAPDLAGEG